MIRLFTFLALVASSYASINEEVLLDAIAMVETGNRDIVGAAGERGKWQLAPSVRAKVGGHDRAAARRWLKLMIRDLGRANIHICAYNLALTHNAGITAVRRGRVPVSTYHYANRVDRLYRALLEEVK
jgi:hypothetical protein